MKIRTSCVVVLALFSAIVVTGCNQNAKKAPLPPAKGKVSSFAEVAASTPLPVQGYGIVAGLAGTGSAQCPPQIRNYLRQYILAQLPKDSLVTADQLLDSPNTAAVKIDGVMPPMASKGDIFDLRITPVPGTQTTSFAGGRLYTANLQFGRISKAVAKGQGSVFLDLLGTPNLTTGYVLGGGTVSSSMS
jgi:flagellar basal body P-ring protein FlgI